MKKLARFVIVTLLFVAVYMLLYSLIPFMVWVFGGPFKEVAQSVPYVTFVGILLLVVNGVIFDSCFDTNFYPKK